MNYALGQDHIQEVVLSIRSPGKESWLSSVFRRKKSTAALPSCTTAWCHRFSECPELRGTYNDHQNQLLSKGPNRDRIHNVVLLTPCSNQLSQSQLLFNMVQSPAMLGGKSAPETAFSLFPSRLLSCINCACFFGALKHLHCLLGCPVEIIYPSAKFWKKLFFFHVIVEKVHECLIFLKCYFILCTVSTFCILPH